MTASSGGEILPGGGAADRPRGGTGDDILHGEGGRDVVILRASAGPEVIRDFEVGIDRIRPGGGGAIWR